VASNMCARGRLTLVALFASAAMLLVMMSACAPATSGSGPQANMLQNTSAGLHVRLDVDKFEFTFAQQFCQTLVTAEIVVGSHGTARWNTPNGILPAGISTSTAVIKANLRVYTPVTFTRFVPMVDHRHMATKEFLTVGGQVGKDSYQIDEDPGLAGTGGHFIVVLYPSTPQTGGNTEEALVVGNAYPVDSQGMVTLQQAGNSNEPGTGQLQPAITIPLASLKQQLVGCK
jgi:hypothetical protein